jgi:beta-lactamase class A
VIELEAFLGEQIDKVIAVALHDLDTEREIPTNANEPFHPPSTIKIHVMMEYLHQPEQRSLATAPRHTG